MSADTLFSRTIMNLSGIATGGTTVDANLDPVYDSAGFNIGAPTSFASDYATATTAGLKDTGSVYRLVRVRSNLKLRRVRLFTGAVLDSTAASLTWDVGAYYSNSTKDGTQQQLQGTAISVNAFIASVATPTAAGLSNAIESAAILPESIDKMLWEFLGLSADPGGYIDLVAAVHTAGSSSYAAGGTVGIAVDYAN